MPTATTEHASAKVNLALSVGPPGVDRMHPISSWMVSLDFGDELEVKRLDPGSLSRYAIVWHPDASRRSEIDWSITQDLAVRAHLALERHCTELLPIQLHLQKRIPVGGGLGGGSSNAAAMLRAVNRLYELGLSNDELATIGAGIGSDVPFLVHGGSAIVEGLGDRVEPCAGETALDLVLVFPEVACPTGEVYAAFDRIGDPLLRAEDVRALAAADQVGPEAPFNDLATAAQHVAPRLGEAISRISRLAERPAHVSGSGSTLFVLCDDTMHAEALARAVAEQLDLPAVAARASERSD